VSSQPDGVRREAQSTDLSGEKARDKPTACSQRSDHTKLEVVAWTTSHGHTIPPARIPLTG